MYRLTLQRDPWDFDETPDLALQQRRALLRGGFPSECFLSKNRIWRTPLWCLRVFVSSTFTDTHVERNILMNEILPDLRQRASGFDTEVTFVDMRWGVRDENTLDHMTWVACSKMLESCRETSCGLFFLSLQSEK